MYVLTELAFEVSLRDQPYLEAVSTAALMCFPVQLSP